MSGTKITRPSTCVPFLKTVTLGRICGLPLLAIAVALTPVPVVDKMQSHRMLGSILSRSENESYRSTSTPLLTGAVKNSTAVKPKKFFTFDSLFRPVA